MANAKMSEETKKSAAEKRAATIAAKKEAEQKANKELEELRAANSQLQEQIARLTEMMEARNNAPTIIQMASPEAEKVYFQWQAEVADDNVEFFGDNGAFGRIVGKTGTFYVPKPDLSRLLDEKVRLFLDRRWLTVLSGLSDEEMESIGARATDPQVLSRKAFQNIVEMGEAILEIYPKLCDAHKAIVAKRYNEAWQNGADMNRDIVTKLNNMSKQPGHEKGDFVRIIDGMNQQDAT